MGEPANPFEAVRAMMLENLEKMQSATQSYRLKRPCEAFRVPMTNK